MRPWAVMLHANRGRLCVLSEACSKGFFGEGCEQRCDCAHSSSCHHVTGRCECVPGWRGARCDKCECVQDWGNCGWMKLALKNIRVKWLCVWCVYWLTACLPGFYGASCAQRCQCQAGVSCHHETGSCGCPAGLTGAGCEKSKKENKTCLNEF